MILLLAFLKELALTHVVLNFIYTCLRNIQCCVQIVRYLYKSSVKGTWIFNNFVVKISFERKIFPVSNRHYDTHESNTT